MTTAIGSTPRRSIAALLVVITVGLSACAGNDLAGDRASTRSPAVSSTTAPTTPPATSTPPTTTPSPATDMPRGTPARITIPTIGVDAAVVDLGKNPDGTLEVPGWQDAGWWRRGPEPGERGPAVIVGHVDSSSGPDVFYRLGELRAGELVEIGLDDGGTARYVVDRLERFAKDAFPTRDVYDLTPGPELRLITCDGDFDTATGHYLDNLVVFATPA
jgi:sortase (surface protein transpeptidase)